MRNKLLAVLVAVAFAPPTAAATTLGVAGSVFTVNGRPTFLLGCSYYAGLGAPDRLRDADLDRLRKLGFNWIRVWATWNAFGENISAVAGSGEPREPYLSRLRALVQACDRRGLVVDVTLSRGRDQLSDLASHRRAVETIAVALKSYRNWYLDLANERNVGDARYVSFGELTTLRAAAREVLPGLLVTASQGGDLSQQDVRRLVEEVGVDFLTPHRPRHSASPAQTEQVTKTLLEWTQQLGRLVPVHYQEPFRRGYGDWQPSRQDYLVDLEGALRGGAAGWCFHNGSTRGAPAEEPRRSFDLRRMSLFDQLDAEERATLTELGRTVRQSSRQHVRGAR